MGDVGLAAAGTIPLILIAPDGLLERFPIRLNLSSAHARESGHPDRATMLGILGPRFRGDERKPIQSDRNLL